jgi:quinol-cytochrome oxidoreductase complex cytochrome b subunit
MTWGSNILRPFSETFVCWKEKWELLSYVAAGVIRSIGRAKANWSVYVVGTNMAWLESFQSAAAGLLRECTIHIVEIAVLGDIVVHLVGHHRMGPEEVEPSLNVPIGVKVRISNLEHQRDRLFRLKK